MDMPDPALAIVQESRWYLRWSGQRSFHTVPARLNTEHPRSGTHSGEQIVCRASQQAGGSPPPHKKLPAADRKIDKPPSQVSAIISTPGPPETHLVIDQPMFKLSGFLMPGSMGVFGFIGESTTVLILIFLLLLSGDTFKRKPVRLTCPSLSDKTITVHIGIFIITWMTDKIGKMNAVTIFVVLLFYGWLT
jgi:hypothetical protein